MKRRMIESLRWGFVGFGLCFGAMVIAVMLNLNDGLVPDEWVWWGAVGMSHASAASLLGMVFLTEKNDTEGKRL